MLGGFGYLGGIVVAPCDEKEPASDDARGYSQCSGTDSRVFSGCRGWGLG
jgi:hypothetical protein